MECCYGPRNHPLKLLMMSNMVRLTSTVQEKKKYGVNLQAICDYNLMFRWIDIMYPGSASDYIAWGTSTLFYDLENNCSDMILPGCTLIGDSAYVKKPYMSVPIKKKKLEPHEDGYNYYLSQILVTIE